MVTDINYKPKHLATDLERGETHSDAGQSVCNNENCFPKFRGRHNAKHPVVSAP